MRVVVDLELCQGHGVCVGEAPTVFRVRERPGDYAQVEILLESPGESLRAQAEAAVRYCPNRALSLIEDDAPGR
ncbi:MAG TPA: ferredoxin [Myxococcota bacterium]|nr:ferredoxin [Myxococcota bacterium]